MAPFVVRHRGRNTAVLTLVALALVGVLSWSGTAPQHRGLWPAADAQAEAPMAMTSPLHRPHTPAAVQGPHFRVPVLTL